MKFRPTCENMIC